jgi:hypothetical protein
MPIINWVYALEGEGPDEEETIKRIAKDRMDEATNLRFVVNGLPVRLNLSDFRVHCVVPEMALINDNIFDMKPCLTTVVIDGYWIFFRPLKELNIETHGSCQSGRTRIAINYHITVTNSKDVIFSNLD